MDYFFLIIPLLAAIIAQLIKMIINATKDKFTWRDFNSYGGMPSSHAALVTSLSAIVGYFEGWDSAFFAISFILMILVIRDAGGFRRVLGKHSQLLNQLAEKQPSDTTVNLSHQTERLGHTPLELFFGALIGLLTTVIYILLA